MLLAVAAVFLSFGCTLRPAPKPAVLVLAVENLGFNSFSCDETSAAPEESGFDSFCQEAVRYTHAYTVSPLSQAAMASVMTGLYPREHGVRHNGAQAISPALETVSEVAVKKGLATSFYSGGPSVWRRGGFGQGFAVFDDNVQVSLKTPYRPASSVVDLFLHWQESDARNGGFFSVLFFADPQFVDQPTANDLGEVRESSYRGQLDEVGEALGKLVSELKARHVWDSTYVFLVGLDGKASNTRIGEPSALNLYSESTHVTLMIKPATKKRDSPINWKIDSNVSLVDVGATLYDLVDPDQVRTVSRIGAVSLRHSLDEPAADWPPDRRIVSESAWAEWRGAGPTRAAVRQGPFLYLFDQNDKLYDTLTDSLEVAPLPRADERAIRVRSDLAEFLKGLDYTPWSLADSSILEKSILAEDLWREQESPLVTARLISLSRLRPDDWQLRGWRAIFALESGNWFELSDAARDERPLWKYVSEANSVLRSGAKKTVIVDSCLLAIEEKFTKSRLQGCEDEGGKLLLAWANPATGGDERETAKEAFFKKYGEDRLTQKIARESFVGGNRWDVRQDVLAGPSITDLMLAMPEMKKYRAAARARLASDQR